LGVVEHQLQEALGLGQRDRHVATMFVGGGIRPEREAHVEPGWLIERAAAFDEGFRRHGSEGSRAATAPYSIRARKTLDGRPWDVDKQCTSCPCPRAPSTNFPITQA